jgi:hypothetical protein
MAGTGRQAVIDFVRHGRELLERIRFEVHDILASDTRAVIVGELASKLKINGKILETAYAIILTVCGDKMFISACWRTALLSHKSRGRAKSSHSRTRRILRSMLKTKFNWSGGIMFGSNSLSYHVPATAVVVAASQSPALVSAPRFRSDRTTRRTLWSRLSFTPCDRQL